MPALFNAHREIGLSLVKLKQKTVVHPWHVKHNKTFNCLTAKNKVSGDDL